MKSFISKLGVSLTAFALVVAPTLALAQTAPTVSIVSPSNNAQVTVNQAVTLQAQVSGGVAPVKYNWTFSEGEAKSGQTVSHTFTSTGSKTITVKAIDRNLADDTETITVNVVNATTQDVVISNVQVTDKTQNAATITWTTNIPATSRVIYDTASRRVSATDGGTIGSAPNYGYTNSTTRDDAKVTSHSVRLTGLTPNTTYYFRVLSAR